jgi:hypothetical protein
LIAFASEKATMSEYLMKLYIETYLSKSDLDWLVMDEFAAHKTENIIGLLMELSINPLFVPAGFTSILQMLDYSVNKPIKSHYGKFWNDWLSDENLAQFTERAGNIVKPDMQLCLQWVSESLNRITPATIKRSFECCGLKDGDWLSFEHLNDRIKKLFQIKIGIDDWDDEMALLEQFNKEKNCDLDFAFLNAELN